MNHDLETRILNFLKSFADEMDNEDFMDDDMGVLGYMEEAKDLYNEATLNPPT